ncbi:MAG TPA: hypothetical protein VGN43_19900 [Steroidobacteraceae bacterium]|nr:hypothetical protein [Steroidobacteraceae bacterium]
MLYRRLPEWDNYLCTVIAGNSAPMSGIFHRPKLALEMVRLLLRPSSLETRVRSGLFISGPRQTGKSTFLTQDVIPTLEAAGAVVIYVDLWKAAGRTPDAKLIGAVRKKLIELDGQKPQSFVDKATLLLKRIGISSAEMEASIEPSMHLVKAKLGGKLKLNFDAAKIGAKGGASLSDALLEVSKKTRRDIIFIVDEVQEMMRDGSGLLLMQELKATRDEINTQQGSHGYFIFVGNGSNRSLVHEMTAQRKAAFYGAKSERFPPLGKDYVRHVLGAVGRENTAVVLPGESAAYKGFRVLGMRPSLFEEALSTLQRTAGAGRDPDAVFDGIVNTLYDQQGKVELAKLSMLGELSQAVFARICRGPEEGVTGLYAGDALIDYAKTLGLDEVSPREVQSAFESLKASNLVMRNGDRGPVMATDPFMRESWLRLHQHGESDIDRSSMLGGDAGFSQRAARRVLKGIEW